MTENTANKLAGATVVQTPKKTLEFMVIGFYPPFYSKKRGENTLDIPCWLLMGYKIKPLILMVYGDDNIQQALKLESIKVYASELDIEIKSFKDNRGVEHVEDVFKAELDDNSKFKEVTAPTWLKSTIEERIQQVLKLYSHVPLCDAEKHLSMMEKNSKGYVDKSDIKVINVKINSIEYDQYVTLNVEDATRGSFPAYVSHMMLMKAQTGDGSTVKLLGTLESNGQRTTMNVCNILPIERMPLTEKKLKISPV